ncbi:AAA family ATPase [Sphingomonas sp. R647]|uniref:AAA family ATPase n=1 Tax=Sphingomonas sp. R647 TaxID=2875233 RepID=UPI001CD68AB4|nr:AAA family ATPase [Sphingomonas sp. R647]MCA1197376.1 AAA family ATPase [Sphingomonas sp. R647]
MYDDHYGLSGRPFQLTPDPAFWYDTATHKKAMAYLGYGLSQGEGFIVITGAPGAGKTTLVGHLMETIDPERLHVIKIVTTQIEAEDLLQMVAAGLNIDATHLTKAQMLAGIEKQLHAVARQGRRTLLIADEAQALPIESLEELRMLSNFQAGGYPLLQIFLLGQPEFRARLSDPRLDQLRQRVIAMHQLDGMGADELEPYLIHRLSCVGWRGKPRFTNDAVAAMYRWSGGIPRKVNLLAGRVLLLGAIEEITSFTGADVEAVIADLEGDLSGAMPPSAPARPAPIPAPAEAAHSAREALRREVSAPAAPAAGAVPPAPAPVVDADLAARFARLEARIEEQDAALRRVLTLMVDFIEVEDARPTRRGAAA